MIMIKKGTIRAYVGWNDYSKFHYYENFTIIEELPELEPEMVKNEAYNWITDIPFKIEDIKLDCEQANDDYTHYNFYKISCFNNDDYFFYKNDEEDCVYEEYVAVLKDEED